jgi:alpha-1,2-mannosyltransferase
MPKFWNAKRVRSYPRIIMGTIWCCIILTVILNRGRLINTYLGVDFLSFYSSSILYWQDITKLYDVPSQYHLQQLIYKIIPPDSGITYVNPPYFALAMSPFALLPFNIAFFVWTIMSIGSLCLGIYLLTKKSMKLEFFSGRLGTGEFICVIFSFFPTIIGLISGQNHALTFLLVTMIILQIQGRQSFKAGIFAGLLLYKPQLSFGFIFYWIISKSWRAICGFTLVGLILFLSVWISHGIEPFTSNLNSIKYLYVQIFSSGGLGEEVNLHSVIQFALPGLFKTNLSLIITYCISGFFLLYIYLLYKKDTSREYPALLLCLLLPFVISPHILVYDLLMIIPVLVLLIAIYPKNSLIWLVLFVNILPWVYKIFGLFTNFPMLSLIPLAIIIYIFIYHNNFAKNEISR